MTPKTWMVPQKYDFFCIFGQQIWICCYLQQILNLPDNLLWMVGRFYDNLWNICLEQRQLLRVTEREREVFQYETDTGPQPESETGKHSDTKTQPGFSVSLQAEASPGNHVMQLPSNHALVGVLVYQVLPRRAVQCTVACSHVSPVLYKVNHTFLPSRHCCCNHTKNLSLFSWLYVKCIKNISYWVKSCPCRGFKNLTLQQLKNEEGIAISPIWHWKNIMLLKSSNLGHGVPTIELTSWLNFPGTVA